MLVVACLAAPTVQLIAAATGRQVSSVVGLLEAAEDDGIIEIDGARVRFTHPLLARGVYTGAAPSRRREVHRRLSDIVEEPEVRARHLALASVSAEPETLRALDAAAKSARMRGAPEAAAELLDMAAALGGDTPERRIRSAANHFAAGDIARARAILEAMVDQLAPGPMRATALSVLGGVRMFDDSFAEAAGLLERALGESGEYLPLRVQVLITLTFALYNTGQIGAAVARSEAAVADAELLEDPHVLSQAIGMRVMLGVLEGERDEPNLRRALELEDPHANTPAAFRPSMQNALTLAWTGRFDEGRRELQTLQRRCAERGEEHELMFVSFHCVVIDIWRADFGDARLLADDAVERALQLGGDIPLAEALTMRAAVAAYHGDERSARADAEAALAAARRCSGQTLAERVMSILGFLEVSLGNYDAALTVLRPVLGKLDEVPVETAILVPSFVPDATEALIALGHLGEAEALIERMESDGRRLDRPWLLALGGRCRSMLHVARGDLAAASLAAEQAIAHHERLSMPFERARTQLFIGRLQRRRRRTAAAETLRDAAERFTELGTPLWADRARAELTRATVPRNHTAGLTAAERHVAELAASGMTNRDVAAALFISPKTVESRLSRIYTKLGIRSRAELGRRMSGHDG